MRQKESHWVLFLLLIGTILYWNSLRTPFMWDEDFLIVQDPRVHHWSHLAEIFKRPFFFLGNKDTSALPIYYRPLSTLSFRIEYLFWGLNPLGYHITNLFLHLANTLMIYALYKHFLKNVQLAFWGAFLFLAHPAHVEAVTYIPSRTDLLSFFFFLASFYFYVKGQEGLRKFWFYFGSVLCYGLALLSKERAVFLPLLILAHILFVSRGKVKSKRAEGALLLSMVFCIVGYALIRRHVFIQRPFLILLDIRKLPLRLFVLPEILFSYARIWFFPWPLYMGRIVSIEVLSVKQLIFEWSFFLVFLAALLFFFRKPLERFWLVWVVVGLLPVIQIFPIYFNFPNTPHFYPAISEYLLYFTSVGIIGLLASRFGSSFVVEERGNLPRSAPTVLLGAILTVFSFLVIWRNGEYMSRLSLFEQTVRYAPWHSVAYNQIGIAYLNEGELKKAEAFFRKSLSITPRATLPYVNLGLMAHQKGDLEKAEEYYRKALELIPDDSAALHNFGILYIVKKEWRKAIECFEKAIKAEPYIFSGTHLERAHAYWELGEKEKALQAVEEGLRIRPHDPMLENTKRWMKERL